MGEVGFILYIIMCMWLYSNVFTSSFKNTSYTKYLMQDALQDAVKAFKN